MVHAKKTQGNCIYHEVTAIKVLVAQFLTITCTGG